MNHLKTLILFAFAFIIFAGCKKDDTKVAQPAQPATLAELYFSAKIDGKDHLLEALVNGYGSGAGASSGNSSGIWEENQTWNLINMTTQQGSGVILVKAFGAKPNHCDEIRAMFKVGSYPFGLTGDGSLASRDGAVVYYVDAAGTYWASDLGTADQTGSTFEILEHTTNTDGFSEGITKARFSCKLYDGKGNSKTLTNGEIRSRSVQCGHL